MVSRITYLFMKLDRLGTILAFVIDSLAFSGCMISSLLKSHASGQRPFFDRLRLLLDTLETLWSRLVSATLIGMLLLFTVEILSIL